MRAVILPAIARCASRRPTSREATVVAGALGLFAVIVGGAVLWVARTDAASIRPGTIHAVALALLGAGAVMALTRSAPHRLAAVAALALGVAAFWCGPEVAAVWVPLGTGPLAVSEAATATTYRGSLDRTARRLMLSPSGARFAVRVGTWERNEPDDVLVGHVGGAPRQVVVHDLSFLDDARVIAVVPSATGLEARTLTLDRADATGWSASLPPLRVPRVAGDGDTGIWGVVGWDSTGPRAVTAAGRMPGALVEVRHWRLPDDDTDARVIFVSSTGTAFAVRTAAVDGPAWLSRLAGVGRDRWELWRLGEPAVRLATTSAILLCLEPLAADDGFFCVAQHAAHSVVWSVAGRDGSITRVGAIASRVRLARPGPGHLLLLGRDDTVFRVPRDGRGVTRSPFSAEPGVPIGLDSSRSHFATLHRDAHRTYLSIHAAR